MFSSVVTGRSRTNLYAVRNYSIEHASHVYTWTNYFHEMIKINIGDFIFLFLLSLLFFSTTPRLFDTTSENNHKYTPSIATKKNDRVTKSLCTCISITQTTDIVCKIRVSVIHVSPFHCCRTNGLGSYQIDLSK